MDPYLPIDSYYSMCLDNKITQLFSNTVLGIDYWKKHKNQRCYICKKKGHLASVCDKVCKSCNNYHPSLPVCIFNMNKFMEKIFRILEKGKCENLVGKYKRIVEEEERIKGEELKKQNKELSKELDKEYNFYNIKKYSELKISKMENVNFDGAKFEMQFNEYKINDCKYRYYALSKFDKYSAVDNCIIADENIFGEGIINKIWNWMFKKKDDKIILKANEVVLPAEEEEIGKKMQDSSENSERLTIHENAAYNVPRREVWLQQREDVARKEKLKELKERKRKIENKSGFSFEKQYKKIKKIGDITRIYNNLKWKADDLRQQNEDVMDRINDKVQGLNKIKRRMHHIYQEKNNILNAARRKGERIKRNAYRDYKYWFGNKQDKSDYLNEEYENRYQNNDYDDDEDMYEPHSNQYEYDEYEQEDDGYDSGNCY